MLSQNELNDLKKVLLLTPKGFWVPQVPPDNDFYLASLELERQGFVVRKEVYQNCIFFLLSASVPFPTSLF